MKICKTCRNCGLCTTKTLDSTPVLLDTAPISELGYANSRHTKFDIGIAFDIGTTTIAASAFSLATGMFLASAGEINRQHAFGTNVVSRIEHALSQEGLEELHGIMVRQIEDISQKLILLSAQKTGFPRINLVSLVISGNTAMESFLMKTDVSGLAQFPFSVTDSFGREFCAGEIFDPDKISDKCTVYISPVISPFIGGDISSGLLALNFGGILHEERKDGGMILCDMGTNCEICMWDANHCKATSAAAGPAFEAKGLLGTNVVSMTAGLIRDKMIDSYGNYISAEDQPLSQEEVRSFQLAKAAVATGLNYVIRDSHQKKTEIHLSGGFGTSLNKADALTTGLIPREINAERIVFDGNTSLSGSAVQLLFPETREKLKKAIGKISIIDLAANDDFQKEYLKNLNF